jgi:serine/threonine-protein phosphatase CPPED1
MTRFIALVFLLASAAPAQTFIQLSDPQFGMYTKDKGFEHETANLEFAVATVNRLKPAFVVVTGDLVNKSDSAAQAAEYKRIMAKVDPAIRVYSMPGNHDVGNEPTKESLAAYRERLGPDYYSFRNGAIAGFVLDSGPLKAPQNVPAEAEKMERWLRAELAKARADGAKHLVVFLHHPLFLTDPDEAEKYDNLPVATRRRLLELFHEFGVRTVFAGHYHQNASGRAGDLEMVTTGPVGMPLRGAKSGMRIVVAGEGGITHRYYEFGDLPDSLPSEAEIKRP